MRPPAKPERPFRLRLSVPVEATAVAQTQLAAALAATGLDAWFDLASPTSGPWALWWDDTAIWVGSGADPAAWQEALLEGWWGSGGGCC